MLGEAEDREDNLRTANREMEIMQTTQQRKQEETAQFQQELQNQHNKTQQLLNQQQQQQLHLQQQQFKMQEQLERLLPQQQSGHPHTNSQRTTKDDSTKDKEPPKDPDVYIFHDSLGRNITPEIMKRDNLTTEKLLTYNLDEVVAKIPLLTATPKAVVLHVGTNDIDPKKHLTKGKTLETVATNFDKVIKMLKGKFPKAKLIISDIVSRDNLKNQVRFINSQLGIKYEKDIVT